MRKVTVDSQADHWRLPRFWHRLGPIIALSLTQCTPSGSGGTNAAPTITPNAAPTITAGPTASPATVLDNHTSQLSVTASDPNNEALTYTWQPTLGTITGSGPSVTFNAPAVTASTVVRINLTVTDPGGLSVTGFVDVPVQKVLYQQDFTNGASGWTVVDDPSARNAPSIWSVVNGQYQESSGSRYPGNTGISGQTTDGYAIATYSRYDGASFGAMDLRLRLRSTGIGVLGVIFGYQNDGNYYRVSLSKRDGYRKLQRKINGTFSELASSPQSYTPGQWMGLRIVFQNGTIVVLLNDDQVLGATDTSFTTGRIGLWVSSNGPTQYDEIVVSSPPTQAVLVAKTPSEYFVTPDSTLNVSAVVNDPTTIGGVEFVVDEGTATEVRQTVFLAPYTAAFTLLASGTHQIRAYGLDDSSQRLSTRDAQDAVPGLGVNGLYLVGVGDSITNGDFDDQPIDDISQDGRNTCAGYEPILNNLLTADYDQPVTVIDEGRPGDTATRYLGKIGTVLTNNPTAQAYLVLLGTNDAISSSPPPSGLGLRPGNAGYSGSYKESIQRIVDRILAARKKVFLAKLPPFIGNATANQTIEQYNRVIDELVTDNAASGLIFIGPDFYSYFTAHPEQMSADRFHPNGSGYAAMAPLWRDSLVGYL